MEERDGRERETGERDRERETGRERQGKKDREREADSGLSSKLEMDHIIRP